MKRHFSMLAVPLVAGLLFVAGCSDDDEPPPPVGPTSTPTTGSAATATRTNPPVNTPTHTVAAPPTATATSAVNPTATNTPEEEPATPTATGVIEDTPTPTATVDGGTPTETPTGGPDIICGDGTTTPPEECDDGDNYGGDGCAANCTNESDITLTFSGGSSGSVVQAVAFKLELPISGSQVLTHGSARTDTSTGADGHSNFAPGEVPLVSLIDKNINEDGSPKIDPIQIPGIACACLRGIQFQTCGGLPTVPGNTDAVCSAADGSVDPAKCSGGPACAVVYGPNVSAGGVIGCAGISDVNYSVTLDSISGETVFERSGGPVEVGAINNSFTAIGVIMGNPMCIEDTGNANNGPDGFPCTNDDPASARGTPNLNVQTTGNVAAAVLNANGNQGVNIDADSQCGASPCDTTGAGAPKSCEDLLAGNTSGLCLASAFAALAQPSLGDIAVPATFCAE